MSIGKRERERSLLNKYVIFILFIYLILFLHCPNLLDNELIGVVVIVYDFLKLKTNLLLNSFFLFRKAIITLVARFLLFFATDWIGIKPQMIVQTHLKCLRLLNSCQQRINKFLWPIYMTKRVIGVIILLVFCYKPKLKTLI